MVAKQNGKTPTIAKPQPKAKPRTASKPVSSEQPDVLPGLAGMSAAWQAFYHAVANSVKS